MTGPVAFYVWWCILAFALPQHDASTNGSSSTRVTPHFVDIAVAEDERATFRAALGKATGIYRSPPQNQTAGLAGDFRASNTVLVVSFNAAYFPFFENWVCLAERVGLKYLVWPQEHSGVERVAQFLAENGHGQSGTLFYSPTVAEALQIGAESTLFRQGDYNVIVDCKLMIVRMLLNEGLNVWFTDVDVAFIRDPWPFFRHRQACDYQFQPERKDYDPDGRAATRTGNTGFHLFRSNNRTRELVRLALVKAEATPSKDDQVAFWMTIRLFKPVNVIPHALTDDEVVPTADDDDALRICPLPIERFPSGNLLLPARYAEARQYLASGKLARAVIVHANFVSGREAKTELLESVGLWAIGDNAKCSSHSSLDQFERVSSDRLVPSLPLSQYDRGPSTDAQPAAGGHVAAQQSTSSLQALEMDFNALHSNNGLFSNDTFALLPYGLFSMLNRVAHILLIEFLQGRRACFIESPEWSYSPSEAFERAVGCQGIACYIDRDLRCAGRGVRAPKTGRSNAPMTTTRSEHHLAARYPGVDLAAARGVITRWLYRLPDHVTAAANTRLENVTSSYISIQVRWGDKVVQESVKRPMLAYLDLAQTVANKTNTSLVLFFTIDVEAVQALHSQLGDNPSSMRYIIPRSELTKVEGWLTPASREQNAIGVLADVLLIVRGRGAVMTISSNMAEFVHFYRLDNPAFVLADADSSHILAASDVSGRKSGAKPKHAASNTTRSEDERT
jgi:hypothetical protein